MIRKDLNFREDIRMLNVPDPNTFIRIIEKDCDLFEDLNLMDYSMLVYRLKINEGILRKFYSAKEWKYYHKNFFLCDGVDDDGNSTAFCFTIIDYLQDYNFFKNMEYIYKNFINLKKKLTDGIVEMSCVPPDRYAKRFVEYFKDMVKEEIIVNEI